MQISWLLLLLIIVFELNVSKCNNEILKSHGQIYKPDEYPYVLIIHIYGHGSNRDTTCTGSLVSTLFVLTAAHCTYRKTESDLYVVNAHKYVPILNIIFILTLRCSILLKCPTIKRLRRYINTITIETIIAIGFRISVC